MFSSILTPSVLYKILYILHVPSFILHSVLALWLVMRRRYKQRRLLASITALWGLAVFSQWSLDRGWKTQEVEEVMRVPLNGLSFHKLQQTFPLIVTWVLAVLMAFHCCYFFGVSISLICSLCPSQTSLNQANCPFCFWSGPWLTKCFSLHLFCFSNLLYNNMRRNTNGSLRLR